MSNKKLTWTGGVGSMVAAICCFTPVLALLLSVLGLSSWLGWIDYVLFPALAIFLAIMGCGLFLRRRSSAVACCGRKDVKTPEHVK